MVKTILTHIRGRGEMGELSLFLHVINTNGSIFILLIVVFIEISFTFNNIFVFSVIVLKC